MIESKDSAIKLFGMKIPLSSVLEAAQEEDDISTQKNQNETQSEKDKTLKKPTKILPCPRCKSMETKFCYYNNYNVNQPRHFCKACQRYWTSGGTMRSVPVGAGRRKNKTNNSSPHYHRHVVAISETNGPVLSFNLGNDQNVSNKEDCSDKTSTARNNETNGLDCFPPPPGGVSWPYTCHPAGFYPVYPYWNIPMLLPPPNYSTLGRDENERRRRSTNGSAEVLVPKTLRIDDPNEAAKSSIWTTLGIKKDISMFKGFDSKKEVEINKQDHKETSLILSANPAAFSRSLNFHEQRL